jgi:hypothetical protein
VVKGRRVVVKANFQIGPYIPTYVGVRQGDPLSPVLFDVVGDVLAIFIKKSLDEGIITA